ncbi:hypothetical protein BaRGS_00020982 [Batillaria attramentaria]|uniref:Uncharacterized protein n=1 Tax=Batillaria attramentaria TaxID=370345 RepID=A0ABD0KL58_9CAEN
MDQMREKSAQIVLALIWLACLTKASETGHCSNKKYPDSTCSSLGMTCKTDEQTQILDAVFLSRDDDVTCDTNCQATESAEDSYQCFKSVSDECKQRLSLSDLNTVYTSCDADATATKCNLQPIWQNHRLSTKGAFVVEYICVPQTTCQNYCVVSPLDGYGEFKMTYNFLLGDTNASDDNIVLHKYIFRDHTKDPTPWIKLENSYYYEGTTTLDLNVSIVCGTVPRPTITPEPETTTFETPTPTSETTNSVGPPCDTGEGLGTTHALIIGLVAGVLASSLVFVCVVVYILRKKRRTARMEDGNDLNGNNFTLVFYFAAGSFTA